MLLSEEQEKKQQQPILSTEAGIKMLINDEHSENAKSAIWRS
jgi:hypothetical protein